MKDSKLVEDYQNNKIIKIEQIGANVTISLFVKNKAYNLKTTLKIRIKDIYNILFKGIYPNDNEICLTPKDARSLGYYLLKMK